MSTQPDVLHPARSAVARYVAKCFWSALSAQDFRDFGPAIEDQAVGLAMLANTPGTSGSLLLDEIDRGGMLLTAACTACPDQFHSTMASAADLQAAADAFALSDPIEQQSGMLTLSERLASRPQERSRSTSTYSVLSGLAALVLAAQDRSSFTDDVTHSETVKVFAIVFRPIGSGWDFRAVTIDLRYRGLGLATPAGNA